MTQQHKVSGRKIMTDRLDSGLSLPLQNSSVAEFSAGWRRKRMAEMTVAEIDRWFDEFNLLVKCDSMRM